MRWTLGSFGCTVACIAACAFAPHVAYAQQTQAESEAKTALAAPLRCVEPVAKIASIQGLVELRGLKLPNWQRAQLNDALCLNDSIRVGANSRASFQYTADVTVQLDQNTFVTLLEPKDQASIWTQMWRGALHFITRSRKPYRVITPFANASVEGTEVYIALAKDRADVTVFEGKLDVANDAGQVLLGSGESAIVQGLEAITDDDQFRQLRAEAPRKVLIAKPRDAVQWALYYPPVIDVRAGDAVHPDLKAASEQFRAGNTAEAFAALERVPADAQDAQYLIYRASLKLYVGREQEAQADLNQALQQNAKQSDALALQAIIAVVQSDKEQGLSLAQKAVDADPASAAAQIALSYAQQAIFKLEPALASAEQAAKLDPNNALAYARIAELQLSQGDLDKALTAAKKATELNPNLARTQSILGFSYLTRIDTKNAKETFAKAIQLDSADPLPHLGLGLAKIREGKLAEGRQDIERAVILDPNNSLIRSYVGKAYYEEKRDELAGKQFEIAKELDPRDPTPWFYGAVQDQSENAPVNALSAYNKSIELNGNRLVHRSGLLLDHDDAARTTNLANAYGELGFNKLALLASTRALARDPMNESAHRQLAVAYSGLPRHDIARTSEALLAQLLQPINASPLSPQITTDNLAILRDTGPSRLGDNEFNLLFSRDQRRLQLDAIAGNRSVLGDQLLLSGLARQFAYAIGQLHYEKSGFREHDDLVRDVYDLFLQAEFSPKASASLNLRKAAFELSQVLNAYDPDPNISGPVKTAEQSESIRLGGRYTHTPTSNLIYTAIGERRRRDAFDLRLDTLFSQLDASSATFELQHTLELGNYRLLTGVRRLDEQDSTEGEAITHRSSDFYAYGAWSSSEYPLDLQLGFSYDNYLIENSVFEKPIKRKRFSPKVGLAWSPTKNLHLRLAATSTVKRPLIGNQTIEPSQIAGFTQFFTGFDQLYGDRAGTISSRLGLGMDYSSNGNKFFGLEVAGRRMNVPSLFLERDFRWRERNALAYLYLVHQPWLNLPNWRVVSSLEVEYEQVRRPPVLTDTEGIRSLNTYYAPVGLRLFRNSGLSMKLSTTYVKQDGVFMIDVGFPEFPKKVQRWITDVSVDYRLPKRLGLLSVGAKNVFDQDADVLETDPVNPRIASRRFAYVRARFLF